MGWNRRNSNHTPITLCCDGTDWGPKPLRAFDNWQKEEDILDLIKKVIEDHSSKSWFGLLRSKDHIKKLAEQESSFE